VYAYMFKGKLFLTNAGYAQIAGGWLSFEHNALTSKQHRRIDAISQELFHTGWLYVWSSRKKCKVYASPIDAKGKELDVYEYWHLTGNTVRSKQEYNEFMEGKLKGKDK